MSKVPPFEQLPFSSHRSISVREQRGHLSPRLRRSASTYNSSSEQEAAPVEIGSRGSIFSLVGRDIWATSTPQVVNDAKQVPADASPRHYHIWHNRLWLVLPTASKKRNAAKQTSNNSAKQTSKSGNVAIVVESEKEGDVPTWKRVLRKLKLGYNNYSKFKSNLKMKGETAPNQSEKTNVNILGASMRMRETARRAGFSDTHNAEEDPMSLPCRPLQTEPSTIWERRAVAQINPLDLSHLHTSRLKKEYKRPQVSRS